MSQERRPIAFNETIGDLRAIKPVVGELKVSFRSTGLRLRGRLQTLLKLNCDRCLSPYFQGLSVELDESFVWQENEDFPRDRELSKDDFVEPIPADGIIDITDVVYQAVTLATPTSFLCGQSCPGPPVSSEEKPGQALASDNKEPNAIDPRWQNLKTLFAKEEKEEES
jgi:uncharacterized metal-binding protein YceD (DUF177 family)